MKNIDKIIESVNLSDKDSAGNAALELLESKHTVGSEVTVIGDSQCPYDGQKAKVSALLNNGTVEVTFANGSKFQVQSILLY